MKKGFIFVWIGVLFAIMCVTTTGCKDTKPAEDSLAVDTTSVDSLETEEDMIAETPMPKAADELFDDFIFNFSANKKLQMSRITFPLPIIKNGVQEKMIQKNNWKMDNFFMRQDFYTLIFNSEKQLGLDKDTAVNHAVIEHVVFKTKTVKQYVFNRVNGLWKMTSLEYGPISKNMNASFLEFYNRFSIDKDFQQKSMASQVSFTCPDPDDDFEQMTGTFIPEQWPAFAPDFLPSGSLWNIVYGNNYTKSNRVVFVMRGIANGLEIWMTFRKSGQTWKLVKLNT